MAVMLIESTDPQLSFHIRKNPASGMTIKGMRAGVVSGWFPHGDTQKYAMWFRDPPRKNSFSAESGVDYLDLTQYASTYFAFNSISTMFNRALKLDPEQKSFKHKVSFPLLQMRTEKTITHLNVFLGLDLTVNKVSSDAVSRLALYEVTAEYEGTFNEFMMKVYILFYLLHGDLYQSDIVWMEGMIEKVVKVLQELKAPYFLWYWFKKNILVKRKFYTNLSDELGKNSSDGFIEMEYGDTQEQRKNFVDTLMFRFDKPILDVGCGEGYYLLPYAKRLKALELDIVGVEPDVNIRRKLRDKLVDRKQENASVVSKLDQVEMNKLHDIICIEVIEHMPIEEAKELVVELLKRDFHKLVISTPNSEFNQFYPTLTGFRHDDHHFEFNPEEFKSFIAECLEESGVFSIDDDEGYWTNTWRKVGDCVNGISMSQAIIIEKLQ